LIANGNIGEVGCEQVGLIVFLRRRPFGHGANPG
jgi:hypothetical protein